MIKNLMKYAFLLVFWLIFAQNLAFAQTTATYEREQAEIGLLENQIAGLQNRFSNHENDEDTLIDIRTDTDELLVTATELLTNYQGQISTNGDRLTSLGDPPADGEPKEAEAITVERDNLAELNALLTVFTGKLENVIATGENLVFDVGIVRRDMFTNALFERVSLSSISLDQVGASFLEEFDKFKVKTIAWTGFVWEHKKRSLFLALGLSLIAGIVIFVGGFRYFGHFVFKFDQEPVPSFGARLASAFWSAAIVTLSVTALGVSTYLLLTDFGVLRVDFASLYARLIQSVIALVLFLKLAYLVLAPGYSDWRLINITNKSAKSLYILIVVLFLIKTLSHIGVGVREVLDLPLQNSVLQAFVETVLVALVLLIVSRLRPIVPIGASPEGKGVAWPKWVRLPLLFSSLFLIVLGALGYIALAAFISSQIVITGAILIVIYFGLQSGKSIMQEGAFPTSPIGVILEKSFSLTEIGLNRIGLIFGILVNILVLAAGISVILLQWGFRSQELTSGAYQILTNFQIGGITISFLNIAIGLGLFAIGYFVTRRFQMWLDRNVLDRGLVETGVRNSVRKVFGYFGIAIAAMIAVTAAGFDLSNLALVAGALSLGIGFGLQTIVSNFVSGLILLAERPFKAGDWVETTSVQGIVKEISVRATEIETFARKTVIVPNSELVNAAVGNWTHRSPLGRVEVSVGVSYNHSPQEIIDLLLEVVNENPKILKSPAPHVEFADFGASSLDFNVRAFLADIGNGLMTRNELRVAIYDKFQEKGIEIPYPHQEVFLHQVDDLSAGCDEK